MTVMRSRWSAPLLVGLCAFLLLGATIRRNGLIAGTTILVGGTASRVVVTNASGNITTSSILQDNGTNATLLSGQLLVPTGSASAPGLAGGATDASNDGFSIANGAINVVTNGVIQWLFNGLDLIPNTTNTKNLGTDAFRPLQIFAGTSGINSNGGVHVQGTIGAVAAHVQSTLAVNVSTATSTVHVVGTMDVVNLLRVGGLSTGNRGITLSSGNINLLDDAAIGSSPTTSGSGTPSNSYLAFNPNPTAGGRLQVIQNTNATNTTGANSAFGVAGTFAPASGSGSWAGVHLNPTINGTSSGTAYGLLLASVTNTLTNGTIRLASFGTTTTNGFTGYTEVFSVSTVGNLIATGTVNISAAGAVHAQSTLGAATIHSTGTIAAGNISTVAATAHIGGTFHANAAAFFGNVILADFATLHVGGSLAVAQSVSFQNPVAIGGVSTATATAHVGGTLDVVNLLSAGRVLTGGGGITLSSGNVNLLDGTAIGSSPTTSGSGTPSNSYLAFNANGTAGGRIQVVQNTNATNTSSTNAGFGFIGTFAPASGSGSWAGVHLNPIINGTSSGSAYGLILASRTNTLTGGTIRLLDIGTTTSTGFAGYTSLFAIDASGQLVKPAHITAALHAQVSFALGTHMVTIANNADGATANTELLDGLRSLYLVDCNDPQGCVLQLGTASVVPGAQTEITNVSTNSNAATIASVANVQHVFSLFTMATNHTISLRFVTNRSGASIWVERFRNGRAP